MWRWSQAEIVPEASTLPSFLQGKVWGCLETRSRVALCHVG